MKNLDSVSINDLIFGMDDKKICFVVPSYQRGYRWTEQQINKLLSDLYEYDTQKANDQEYYCLQPIVVKQINDRRVLSEKIGKGIKIDPDTEYYEIVDGQQRMTTVYILLKYFGNDTFSIVFERDKDRNYERRNLLDAFSKSFDTSSANVSFADAHYFVNALDSIKKWFSDYSQKLKKANLASLLSTILCDKTRVIWYPLETKQDCYTIFKNLNHGKIPLTDAELVKAMLLNARNFGSASNPDIVKSEQDHYARVWDEMQKTINDDKIWSFITGGGNEKLPTRIDLIIQLVVKKESSAELAESDHKFFSYFESNLPEDPNNRKEYVESVFEKLRVAFRTIQDWYENYQIHNYIGYLLTYTKDNRINEIIKWMKTYETNEKSAFINALKNTIKDVFKGKSIDEINYEENRNEVEKLLMLFNIEELNQKHEKFNFYTDKEGWSIEHIKAQHSEIVKAEDRRVFLSSEKKSLEDLENSTNDMNIQQKISGFIPQIDNLLKSTDIDENKFIQLIAQIDKDIDGFDDSDMHRLGNLALIWKSDNSSLGNDSFYAKRGKINDWANDVNKNIPYSTVKAFQKMYSDQDYSLDPTRWKKSDFDKMFSKQKEMLGDYIK